MSATGNADIVATLHDIFVRRAADSYLGEPVSIGEHMLQTAQLAAEAGADEATIAAALLHDVGHYTHEFDDDAALQGIDTAHERAGARLLERYFPAAVSDCVRYHVAAKRYLCATEPDYFARLSPASVHSLKLQGGVMNPAEVERFETLPYLQNTLQVRRWDDAAKIPGLRSEPFVSYLPLLRRLLSW